MYLLDSNIFLELLLDQERADQVEEFLREMPSEKLYVWEFSVYSIGIILFRYKQFDTFIRFLDDLIVKGGVRLLRISVQDMADLAAVAKRFGLDFDDGYQYFVAKKYDLEIISFDSDFDRTEKGRKTPDKAKH
jgi:hypothetical protein